jgi:glucuronate isomerase
MRNLGIEEKYITGGVPDKEKFAAFASALPCCIGNPIYIWCHLELKKYFGIETEINETTAGNIYDKTAALMKDGAYSAQRLISRSHVTALCTTDDPVDKLNWHKQIAASGFPVKVYPTFRPDKALNIDKNTFVPYIRALTGKQKPEFTDLTAALHFCLNRFTEAGCFIADHALDNYTFKWDDDFSGEETFNKAMRGESLSAEETENYQTFLLVYLAGQYARRGMAMQLHLCCRRNNNGGMFERLGPDTGFDSIESSRDSWKLAAFFGLLEKENILPKTIVYSLDPNDDKLIDTILNCFQGGGLRGKLQHGSAWWFNDTRFGINSHLKTLSEYSVLGSFIGMLTDSRSFTSYVRHDYFRRILCNHLAECVLSGEYPQNMLYLEKLVKGICCNNAKEYFGI